MCDEKARFTEMKRAFWLSLTAYKTEMRVAFVMPWLAFPTMRTRSPFEN